MISTSCIWHTEVNVFLIRKAVSLAALFSYQHSFITLDIDFSAWNEELITHLSVFLPVCTMWLGLFKGGKGEAPYWRPVWADELWVRETGTFERPSNAVSHFFGRRGYQSAYQAKSVFAYFKTSAFYIKKNFSILQGLKVYARKKRLLNLAVKISRHVDRWRNIMHKISDARIRNQKSAFDSFLMFSFSLKRLTQLVQRVL